MPGRTRPAYVQWLIAHGEPPLCGRGRLRDSRGQVPVEPRKHEPLFSVVVPSLRPPLWGPERCVVSVLTQRFGNFELKICDDCGGDRDVVELLRRCEAMDDRLELVVSDRNGGISDATNRALALATGKYVVSSTTTTSWQRTPSASLPLLSMPGRRQTCSTAILTRFQLVANASLPR